MRLQGLVRASDLGFRVSSFGFRVWDLGYQVSGVGFHVSSVGCKVPVVEARQDPAGLSGDLARVRLFDARNLFEMWDLEPLLIPNPKPSVLYQRPSINGRVAK